MERSHPNNRDKRWWYYNVHSEIFKTSSPRWSQLHFDTNFESLWVEWGIEKKKCFLNLSYCPEKTLMFLEKWVLVIDLAMAEGKSVILAEDYNFKYFAKHDRSLLRSVNSPYDLKPSNIYTTTRMSNSSSTLIDYIITDDYETGIVADTILKIDHFATITVLKSGMNEKKFFDKKKLFSHSVPKFHQKFSLETLLRCRDRRYDVIRISKSYWKSISTTSSNWILLY